MVLLRIKAGLEVPTCNGTDKSASDPTKLLVAMEHKVTD